MHTPTMHTPPFQFVAAHAALPTMPDPTGDVVRAARALGVTLTDVRSGRRTRSLALARACIIWALYRRGHTYLAAALAVGMRDHTSALNAVQRVETLVSQADDTATRWSSMAYNAMIGAEVAA